MDDRHSPRVALSVPIKLRYDSPEKFIQSVTRDLSLGGVAFATNTEVPIGTGLKVTIQLGDNLTFNVRADVVWCKPPSGQRVGSVGARFVELPEKVKAWIEAQVTRARSSGPESGDRHELRKAQGARELTSAEEKLVSSMGAEPVIGIDLGTSNTVACLCRDGVLEVLEFEEPELGSCSRKLPSVVCFLPEEELVGEPAERMRDDAPQNTIYGAKRFIGRLYDSPAVQRMLSRFPYRLVPGAGQKTAVEVQSRRLSLTAISARVLRRVKAMALKHWKTPIDKAIITVPAYYNDAQRQAVVDAGRLAGLEVLRILNEPTAAAIAYGLTRAKPRRLVVYDLGGGTFDVSIMSVHKDSLVVRATAGDTFLGGEDFDHAIVTRIYEYYQKEKEIRLSTNMVARHRIKVAAERAKRALTDRNTAMVTVRAVPTIGGEPVRIEYELTRKELESLCKPLVNRSLKITAMALREAGLNRDDISDVILVGGQSRMPYIRQQVRTAFKREPRMDLDPDEVVAMGAAALATLDPATNAFTDVLSMGIGFVLRGEYTEIFARNTELPAKSKHEFKIPATQFERFSLEVYQGDNPELVHKEHLGTITTGTLTAGKAGILRVRVDFALNEECLLGIRLTNVETMETERVILHPRDVG